MTPGKQWPRRKLFSYRAQLRPGKRLIHKLKVPGPNFCTGLIGQAAHLASQNSIFINDRSLLLWELFEQDRNRISWMEEPVSSWMDHEAFRDLDFFVKNWSNWPQTGSAQLTLKKHSRRQSYLWRKCANLQMASSREHLLREGSRM